MKTPQRRVAKETYEDLRHVAKFGFFGHLEGKQFWRISAEIDMFHQHNPHNSKRALGRKKLQDIHLLHFDCMTFEIWREKWWRRIFGGTRALHISARRARQQEVIRNALNSRDPDEARALFAAWFEMDAKRIRQLTMQQLLLYANIPAALFERPES